MNKKAAHILHYWFGERFEHGMPVPSRNELWFGANPTIDRHIKDVFEADVAKAAAGKHHHWQSSADGRLALIILLDQFTRNIYRGTPIAFACDEIALKLCLDGLTLDHDAQLMPAYRCFYYLPLEHSEAITMQQLCVKLFKQFLSEVDPAIASDIKISLKYAQQHLAIIEKFGRFPHRNRILGRPSSPAEQIYLHNTHSHFGQQSKA